MILKASGSFGNRKFLLCIMGGIPLASYFSYRDTSQAFLSANLEDLLLIIILLALVFLFFF